MSNDHGFPETIQDALALLAFRADPVVALLQQLTKEPYQKVSWALWTADYLCTVGLNPSQLAACRQALFSELVQVGAQELLEQADSRRRTAEDSIDKTAEDIVNLERQIECQSREFLMALEASFRGLVSVEQANQVLQRRENSRERLVKP